MEYSPPDTFYSQVYGLSDKEDMYKFIGRDGVHFKFLTKILGIKYIWWHSDTNIIELWGPHQRLKNAREHMNKKLKKFMDKKEFPALESIVVLQ